MDRRAFVTGLGTVLVTPVGAEAQRAGKVWPIADVLDARSDVTMDSLPSD